MPRDTVRVSTRALREAAAAIGDGGPALSAATIADELVAAVAGLSRDASVEWASVRAAVAAGDAAATEARRLAESIAEVAASLRAAADAYDAAEDRAAGHQPGARVGRTVGRA